MELWRISNHRTLNGEGGRRYGARWHTVGRPIVYLAASAPGALLEILVRLELDDSKLPPRYTLLRIGVPANLHIPRLRVPPGNAWISNFSLTRSIGDKWLRSGRSALARVPSAILPDTFNYLLNPIHPDAARVKMMDAQQVTVDARLIRAAIKS